MKNIVIFLFIVCGFALTSANGQVADGITYQAVAIDENGREIAGHDINGMIIHSKQIDVRFSILSGSQTGELLYKEVHSTYTDQFGLFTLIIGHGDVSSDGEYQKLTDINWGADKLFLKVEIDIKRSGTFKVMGIQQMMAVPFAFHALTSSSTTVNYENILNKPILSTVATSGNYADLLNKPTLFSGNYNDLTNRPTLPTKVSELTNDAGYITNPNDADHDPTNELQTLSLENSVLSISGGNSINLSNSNSDYSFRSIYFPQGVNHPLVSLFESDFADLTVPAGKTMYVLFGEHLSVVIGGNGYETVASIYLPTELTSPVFPSNTLLRYVGQLTYFLVDNDPNIEPLFFRTDNSIPLTYTVPNNKKLIIKSISSTENINIGHMSFNGQLGTAYNLIIPPNTVISSQYGCTFTGYLMDNNGGSSSSIVKDVDNNEYTTVQIGNQTWMVENLRTTRLNDGVPITYTSDNTAWSALSTPSYCWYDNDISNKTAYGALYNWSAAKEPKLCPAGWRVPTLEDWNTLIIFIGGESTAGGKLKESGITHWKSPNTGATNESGFTALPGGCRYNTGTYANLGDNGNYWTSTQISEVESWYLDLFFQYANIVKTNESKKSGFSVRCVNFN